MRPIPLSLLGDTCIVRKPIKGDYGGMFAAPRTIKNVRFEPYSAFHRSDTVLSDGTKGMLFVDKANSVGAFAIPPGSLVEINGDQMMAVNVVELKDYGRQIHHWEVELR